MEKVRWDDLPVFLAIHRAESLSGAALTLGTTASTVHRRLGQLEAALGTRLFDRHPTGLSLTAAGEALVPLAEGVEDDMNHLLRAIAGRDQAPRGRVHLTAPDTLVDLLVEPLSAFRAAFPQVTLEVSLADRYFDLSRREADVAVRPSLSPPQDAVGRRVGAVAWAMYAPVLARPHATESLPWAAYAGSLARLGAAQWQARTYPNASIVLSVNGVMAMQRVVRCTPLCRHAPLLSRRPGSRPGSSQRPRARRGQRPVAPGASRPPADRPRPRPHRPPLGGVAAPTAALRGRRRGALP